VFLGLRAISGKNKQTHSLLSKAKEVIDDKVAEKLRQERDRIVAEETSVTTLNEKRKSIELYDSKQTVQTIMPYRNYADRMALGPCGQP
jgi:hypothetical protein